ncbi:uncharacterized protein VICG_00461 [Vittaforma corneae ATCC 50505]|uniref:Uncharacterized protein n=1 Tax=Vittaforma corneae (strain ATCC 50505) TaxID=993615 RepID=L2GN87_VITCO|nr:uncharacterized protein VICG_00461 [Vittaforma corneae ATCC 50505]ELA42363.1 hypothetical protein VICG_00461 [Vittaforma corneae ATCC 50505]
MTNNWENPKSMKKSDSSTENTKALLEKSKATKKVFGKSSTPSFDSSTSTEPKVPLKEEQKLEEKLSPAQMTINMFEGLANAYIMTEKPFTESEANTNNSSEPENKMMVVNENPIHSTSNENESLDGYSQSTDVTIDELREKIKEILSIPLPEDSQEELKEDEVNLRHEENMKILKQKLRLNMSEESHDSDEEQLMTSDVSQSKGTITESVVRTSVPFRKSKGSNIPKYNLEEARKIFTRSSPKNTSKRKSALDHKVTDLTQETLSISKQTPTVLKTEAFKDKMPILEDSEAYKTYYKEREIVELAKKPKGEAIHEEIQVEYAEINTNKERRSFIRSFLRLVSCGRI